MRLAFHACQHAGHIVEAPDEARSEVERRRPKGPATRLCLLERRQTRSQRRVDDLLQRLPASPCGLTQSGRDVLVQRERGSHDLML